MSENTDLTPLVLIEDEQVAMHIEKQAATELVPHAKRPILRRLAPIFFVAVPLTCLSTCLLNWPSDRVIQQWAQPPTIDYQSFDPYTLSVIKGRRKWNVLSLESHYCYYIFIGSSTEAPEYGHYHDYSFSPGPEDIETHIKASKVEWNDDGLTFIEASGHRLYVPKKMFIGGR